MPDTMQASRLTMAPAIAVLPAEDIDRARKFYHDVLGLEVEDEDDQSFLLRAGQGTKIMVYERARTTAEHTALSFTVDKLDEVMEELGSRGVKFEEYDQPGLKTHNGVASMPEGLAAWFTDPEGNIINLTEIREKAPLAD